MSRTYAGLTYEQTVRTYARSVTSACMMRLQNWADAEDCFQNTFLKLYRLSPEFNDREHLKAWLLRVAINESKNILRTRGRNLPLDSAERLTSPAAEDERDISWALMRLEPKYREVVFLHYCEQYQVAEIAEILDLNPNTVKTLLYRGRKKLKGIYGGDGG